VYDTGQELSENTGVKDKYDTGTDDFLLKLDINNIETEWSAPTEFPDLTKHKTIAIDLETRDDGLGANKGPGWATNDGYVVGIAVAAGDFHGYFPIRHANGPNLDLTMTLGWLQEQMDTPGITKVCHNAPYDIGWLMAEGIKVQGPIIDTLIAAPLVDENRFSYRLDLLGKEYIGMRKDEKVLRAAATEWGIDPKAEMWKLPARFVGGYGEQDAVMTLKLWEHLKAEIEKQDLWSVFDLESRVLPGVIDMRARGVRVDLDQADRSRKILRQRKQELLAFVKDKTGIEVEVWAAESIKKVFEDLGLPYPRTEAGAPSFTKDFLKDHPNEVAQTINKIREADKADSTFIDSILKYEHKGRIHCEMHQLRSDDGGTVTGRFSSSSPNLQQIPARDPEIKKLIRGIFVPEEGERWGSFDYASQEPRLLTHFAASLPPRMRGTMVDEIVKEFHEGNADLHQMVADMAGISRKEAKTVNLGIMYGMGKGKLANQLGISEDEAKRLLDLHQEKVPFVRMLATVASDQAERNGQIRTVHGRLCRFDMWEPRSFGYSKPLKYEEAVKEYGTVGQGIRRAFTYKALNRLIQGSAADQTKLAFAQCYEAGLKPMLQVHDELCFSIATDEQANEIVEIMENGLELRVPSKVDVALEKDWGDVD
jgi:DNA polymerase I-like protein with 3'-5' exonuclease and polymerase domains